jgi:hypothetical protein
VFNRRHERGRVARGVGNRKFEVSG